MANDAGRTEVEDCSNPHVVPSQPPGNTHLSYYARKAPMDSIAPVQYARTAETHKMLKPGLLVDASESCEGPLPPAPLL